MLELILSFDIFITVEWISRFAGIGSLGIVDNEKNKLVGLGVIMSVLKFVTIKKLFSFAVIASMTGFIAGCAGSNSGPMNVDSLGATGGISSKVINRGKSVEIGKFLHWNGNCWAQTIPGIKIVKRPKYGSISVSKGNMMIPSTECKGIPIKGSKMVYRGHRRGTDEFSYRVTSGPRAGIHTVRITVK